MKIRFLLPAAALAAALLGAALLRAQDQAPAGTAAVSPVQTELDALVADIKTKLQAGPQTAATLAPEMKRFDALLAKYAGEKTDDVAKIALMQAMLHLQVFDDYDTGLALLKKLQTDFAETSLAQQVGPLVQELEPMVAAKRVNASLKPGVMFPTFAEQDMDGAKLDLAAYKGKVVLIDFWATWCGPCVAELPNVTAAYEKFKDRGFAIIGISLDDNRADLESFLDENKMPWPQFFDGKGWKNKLAKQYGISAIPATYLLDQEGRIVATDLRGNQLDEHLTRLLK